MYPLHRSEEGKQATLVIRPCVLLEITSQDLVYLCIHIIMMSHIRISKKKIKKIVNKKNFIREILSINNNSTHDETQYYQQ